MKNLICPVCSESLSITLQGIECNNGHQFDRAKEGYFNLLPVQFKNSREPGDAKQQLEARRAFLNAGFFTPLVQALKKLIPADVKSILDIGCGEGYFTQSISAHCYTANVYGIDIAKAGIKLAAKKSQSLVSSQAMLTNSTATYKYVVASSYALPIASGSMDIITRIYAPTKDEELQRIISAQGKLIIVTPGANHLRSLRKKIYQDLKPHPKPQPPNGFSTVTQQQLGFSLSVPAGAFTQALLQMTPFAWRLKPELLSHLIERGLEDTADFQLSVYELEIE